MRFLTYVNVLLLLAAFVQSWSPAPLNRRQAIKTSAVAIVLGLSSEATSPQLALAASGPAIDVNNALAREYTAFPGLYPTIATKIVLSAKEKPFASKKDVYAALGSDLERERLKQYDAAIVIKKPDAALQQFKTSQICKYECGSRVSNSYRDEQIRAVQAGRR